MKLGRLPRRHDPRVPHLSSYLAGRRLLIAPPPLSVDYITPLGGSFGMMDNDTLGDCTCAAIGHARQIWTGNANPPMQTDADQQIVALYASACGYVPGNPNTDQGGDEQSVLTYMLNNGLRLADGTTDKILGFVEVDAANMMDIKGTMADCGVCYIGFNVPDYAMQTVGQIWDVRSGTPNIIGGHAVILAAYDSVGPTCITWGVPQKMTWAFFANFTDEAYALADQDWISATGKTPGGMSLTDMESAMQALKEAA